MAVEMAVEPESVSVRVSCRARPLNSDEVASGERVAWSSEANTIFQNLSNGRTGKSYTVDEVFDQSCNTADVYEKTTKSLVQDVLQGFNGTVFAYGQTGSGKTHTMHGSEEEPGITPLAVQDIFEHVHAHAEEREYLIRVALMEIYNEEIRDLLTEPPGPASPPSPSSPPPPAPALQLREDLRGGIHVVGLAEDIVSSREDLLRALVRGMARRHTGATLMNEQSSRSHCIFRIVLESQNRPQDYRSRAASAALSPETVRVEGLAEEVPSAQERSPGLKSCAGSPSRASPPHLRNDTGDVVLVSTLTLVDLAGSERLSKTHAEGARMREAVNINLSLTALGAVINKLAEQGGGSRQFVPFRDSKLTRLLQPSLGGNARTAVIVSVTMAGSHEEETRSTLEFAQRAKRVRNHVRRNEVLDSGALLKRQHADMEALRHRLTAESAQKEAGLRREMLELERQAALASMQQQQQAEEAQHLQAEVASREAASQQAQAELLQTRAELRAEKNKRLSYVWKAAVTISKLSSSAAQRLLGEERPRLRSEGSGEGRAAARAAVAAERGQMAADRGQVAAERVEVAAQREALAVERGALWERVEQQQRHAEELHHELEILRGEAEEAAAEAAAERQKVGIYRAFAAVQGIARRQAESAWARSEAQIADLRIEVQTLTEEMEAQEMEVMEMESLLDTEAGHAAEVEMEKAAVEKELEVSRACTAHAAEKVLKQKLQRHQEAMLKVLRQTRAMEEEKAKMVSMMREERKEKIKAKYTAAFMKLTTPNIGPTLVKMEQLRKTLASTEEANRMLELELQDEREKCAQLESLAAKKCCVIS